MLKCMVLLMIYYVKILIDLMVNYIIKIYLIWFLIFCICSVVLSFLFFLFLFLSFVVCCAFFFPFFFFFLSFFFFSFLGMHVQKVGVLLIFDILNKKMLIYTLDIKHILGYTIIHFYIQNTILDAQLITFLNVYIILDIHCNIILNTV